MVVLVDLDESLSETHSPLLENGAFEHPRVSTKNASLQQVDVVDDRPNPNINGFSAALSCYPIVSQLASLIDLNTLHDLSRTCRQFRANLLQYRNQLVTQTIRCANEDDPIQQSIHHHYRESPGIWSAAGITSYSGRLTNGKIGQCARDMVGECRRCGKVVCRNCTTKPPPSQALNGRHRRLCSTCLIASISAHTHNPLPKPPTPRRTPSHPDRLSDSPEPSLALTPVTSHDDSPRAFTSGAFERGPCTCADTLWLCQPCGLTLRTEDTHYIRGWTWRTQYSHYLGGLGTGIGEGNQGVPCGRDAACLAGYNVETERDMPEQELAELRSESRAVDPDGEVRTWKGGSWIVQECEGVGGGMRMKTRIQERVGATVKEFEDERNGTRKPLAREKAGEWRSWCAWCRRIIPRTKKVEELALCDRAGER